MITIENTVLPSGEQMEAVIRGARNPLNSWHLADSVMADEGLVMGEKDTNLLARLGTAGPDHGKFLRMIPVYADITGPLYWWKEYDTYKVGTVANSCSTMHKIQAKEFTREDFSCEHMTGFSKALLDDIIYALNHYRWAFNQSDGKDKEAWWQMIQLLPTAFNQKRTVSVNYAVLKAMYHARKNHKLDEWHDFCHWVEDLPMADELIIMGC